MFESKEHKSAIAFINSHYLAVIATSTPKYAVTSSAIYYVPIKNGKLRFVTKNHTAKYKNIIASPQVSLTIVDHQKPKSVNMSGAAAEITDPEQVKDTVRQILHLAQDKLGDMAPIAKLTEGDFVVFEVTPTDIMISDYTGKVGVGAQYNKSV